MFWHSSAHIMGEAMERHYGGHLCYGPPIEEGYYYDMFLDGRLACSYTYLLKLDGFFSFLIFVKNFLNLYSKVWSNVSQEHIFLWDFKIFDIDQSLS